MQIALYIIAESLSGRVFPVKFPFQSIVADIFTGAAKFVFAADDTVIEVAPPDLYPRCASFRIDLFGRLVIKIRHNLAQGHPSPPLWGLGERWLSDDENDTHRALPLRDLED